MFFRGFWHPKDLHPQNSTKGLEILIAVVFCKECVLPVQWWFLFCKGGEDGRGTDGGGGRAKSRIARPKLIIKSCVKMYMNSNIHKEFPAPLVQDQSLIRCLSGMLWTFLKFRQKEKKRHLICKRGWKLIVNVRIHVHFYAGFDDVFWSCNAGFCTPTPSVSSPPILPPLQNKNHHCTGKTHSLQKTTALRISSPFGKYSF